MKNIIKKIASIAMAFTLLGTGTTITKTIAPKFDNSLVANSASKPSTSIPSASCRRHMQFVGTRDEWVLYYWSNGPILRKAKVKYCGECGNTVQIVSYYNQYKQIPKATPTPKATATPVPAKYYITSGAITICSGTYNGITCQRIGLSDKYETFEDGTYYKFQLGGKWEKTEKIKVEVVDTNLKKHTVTKDVYTGGTLTCLEERQII